MKRPSSGNRCLTINESRTMKKIYSFMVAAVALFAAASCNKELPQENLPAVGETVVYTASTDGADTKAVLDGTVSKWCGEELITLHDGTNAFTFYADAGETPVSKVDFTYTSGEDQPVFTATEVMAVYPSGDYTANLDEKIVSNVVVPNNQTLADNTYPATAAVAVAYSKTTELSFKNATTLLKFKVAGDDVTYGCFLAEGAISGKFAVDYNEGKPLMTAMETTNYVDFHMNGATLSKEATYYIAIAPAEVENFKIFLNGQEIKTYAESYKFERNVILDLGTLEYEAPVVHEWAVAGTFNEWSTTANPMELVDGYYVAKNITGLNYSDPNEGETGSSTGIKFVNNGDWKGGEGKVTAGTWAYVWGDGGNIYVDGATAETAYDIYLNPSEGDYGKFVIVAAGATMPEDKPATAQEWYLVGDFNNWTAADANYKMALDGEWYVFENFTADGKKVKFVADADWKINRGGSFIANQAIEVTQDGSDMSVPAGNYDVYLSADAATAYFMTPGLLPGEAPEPEGIYAEEGWVYLKPNSNWTQAGARFAIYFFGNGDTWVSMTKVEGTNYYGVNILDIISKGYTSMIFCRMNPGASENKWENKWNQTGDLKVSDFTSGNNCFSVPSGSWDGATTGCWSTVEKLN